MPMHNGDSSNRLKKEMVFMVMCYFQNEGFDFLNFFLSKFLIMLKIIVKFFLHKMHAAPPFFLFTFKTAHGCKESRSPHSPKTNIRYKNNNIFKKQKIE